MKKIEVEKIDLETRRHSFDEFILGYNKVQVMEEAKRCLNCQNPKCVSACPIGNHIPDFIKEVVRGNIEEAYQILLDKTVLPEICGMVCPHEKQCQGSCVKGMKGDALTIGAIENYVAKYVRLNGLEKTEYIPNGKSIGIVGSGPAGMTAAYYLSKKGYAVTIYEKENYLGGVLSWGIPSFRLDKEIIKNYFDRLKQLHVSFVMNCEIGKDISLQELSFKYNHVLIGVGALKPNTMNIVGEDYPFVIQAKDFLTKLSQMSKEELRNCDDFKEDIIVIGGGNVAMDAARSAIRLPSVKKVTVLYRRSENEMPVNIEELTQAKEEGVEIKTLTLPVEIKEDHKIECALMELKEADESGRRRPVITNKEHVYYHGDTIIMAVGFRNNSKFCEEVTELKKDEKGRIVVDENCKTTMSRVYAAGDSVVGADTVVNAMKQALIACHHIEKIDL